MARMIVHKIAFILCVRLIYFFQEPAVATLPGSLATSRVPQIGEDAVQLNTLLSQVKHSWS